MFGGYLDEDENGENANILIALGILMIMFIIMKFGVIVTVILFIITMLTVVDLREVDL